MREWRDLYTPRQLLYLATCSELIEQYVQDKLGCWDSVLVGDLQAMLSLALGRLADLNSTICRWQLNTPNAVGTFSRWALPMVFDFAEVNPLAGAGGSPKSTISRSKAILKHLVEGIELPGVVVQADASNLPHPDDSADVLFTDPPYFDAIPYSDLLDFFVVWHKHVGFVPDSIALEMGLAPKEAECVVDDSKKKGRDFFHARMKAALDDARRVIKPEGVGVVVFAHKSTQGWETQLSAMIDAGWVITTSWPIDTEMASRLRARDSAALASSIHLVCRPRENPDGSLREDVVGDWRTVLSEIPVRIHQWMPRLAKEGVVGADAIFACLGPALEIFSRYSSVEKATGEPVGLSEYLEHVWATVAREALTMIFEDADTTGLEEDARLTAMWLWTLSVSPNGNGIDDTTNANDETQQAKPSGGFSLEFDAARKVAQGLGVHLENLANLVEIKGDQARLLPVAERTKYLFGKDAHQQAPASRRGKPKQMTLFAELEAAQEEAGWGETGIPSAGETTLDRVHQAMILFAAGRAEALKRFLVEEGVGRDTKFWKLAQSLSALYPAGTEEKRWIDGVLARKKSLGFG